jgi:hypothetical protein
MILALPFVSVEMQQLAKTHPFVALRNTLPPQLDSLSASSSHDETHTPYSTHAPLRALRVAAIHAYDTRAALY